jgi:hypothetical protein
MKFFTTSKTLNETDPFEMKDSRQQFGNLSLSSSILLKSIKNIQVRPIEENAKEEDEEMKVMDIEDEKPQLTSRP